MQKLKAQQMRKGNSPNGVDPLSPLRLRFDVEHPFDDGGELQAADDEGEGPRAIDRHDLAAGDGEVVRGLSGDLSVWQVLVADQRSV